MRKYYSLALYMVFFLESTVKMKQNSFALRFLLCRFFAFFEVLFFFCAARTLLVLKKTAANPTFYMTLQIHERENILSK